jgi:hypothetical protein
MDERFEERSPATVPAAIDAEGEADGLDDLLSAFELQNGNRKDDLEIPAFIRRQMR